MTAFGRSSKETRLGRLVIEVQSLNRRMLDIHLVLPKEFLRFEIEIRKWIAEFICRGGITVRIYLKSEELLSMQIPQLKQLKNTWIKVAEELGYDSKTTVTFPFLIEQLPHLTQIEDQTEEEQMKETLKEGIDIALEELMKMKSKEGQALAVDIESRLKTLKEQLEKVEGRSQFSVEKYKQKLNERMQEFKAKGEEFDDRILKEIAIFAEKLDVSEEQTRLRSHIHQFQGLLNASEKSIGKTLEFLTQELNREVNTLASKSADTELSQITVSMKSEIEKIREQIQNIE